MADLLARQVGEGQWAFEMPQTRPLSLNDRDHRYAKASKVAQYRESAKFMAMKAGIPHYPGAGERVRITLIYEPKVSRRRDPMNLNATLKAVQDGIMDAKVIPDDTITYVESPMPLIDMPNGNRGRLIVLVERIC